MCNQEDLRASSDLLASQIKLAFNNFSTTQCEICEKQAAFMQNTGFAGIIVGIDHAGKCSAEIDKDHFTQFAL